MAMVSASSSERLDKNGGGGFLQTHAPFSKRTPRSAEEVVSSTVGVPTSPGLAPSSAAVTGVAAGLGAAVGVAVVGAFAAATVRRGALFGGGGGGDDASVTGTGGSGAIASPWDASASPATLPKRWGASASQTSAAATVLSAKDASLSSSFASLSRASLLAAGFVVLRLRAATSSRNASAATRLRYGKRTSDKTHKGYISVTASSPACRHTDPAAILSEAFTRVNFAGAPSRAEGSENGRRCGDRETTTTPPASPRGRPSFAGGWWCFDLGARRTLACSHYVMRHDGSARFPRDWVLEGCPPDRAADPASDPDRPSEDGWVALRVHREDRTVGVPGQLASWAVTGATV